MNDLIANTLDPFANAPSAEYFADVVQRTVESFPDAFRVPARMVRLIIAELPDEDMLDELEMTDPMELTGLYEGIPTTAKSHYDGPFPTDTIWLFRLPILEEWRDREDVDLDALISHVAVHEFAHHFGWSDDDIAAIDRWWE